MYGLSSGSRLHWPLPRDPAARGGRHGEVFLAHDDELGRNIAIKLLPAHLADDAEHLARLRAEARSASSLNHPNIVTIYEIGRDDSRRTFMAMEFVDGQTLRELTRSPLPVRKALQLAAQLADGLAAAHKRGLVHRDLKPENIMVTADGVVKILDFGLARGGGVGWIGGHTFALFSAVSRRRVAPRQERLLSVVAW